jgi:predicted DNA-binding ribbon-helix-helix protein
VPDDGDAQPPGASQISGESGGPKTLGDGRWRLSSLVKRSFSLSGHRTSVALEEEFWIALTRVAELRGQSLSALVAAVDAGRFTGQPLASALRVLALREFFPPAEGVRNG